MQLPEMDLDAILLGLAERERWERRRDTLTEDLERLRKRMRALDKTRKRLQREKSRLANLAESLDPLQGGKSWGNQSNERGPPVYPLR